MKILYYDCFSGISGDMNLGAMIDLGVDKDYIINELSKLNISGYNIEVSTDNRKGITGTKVNVRLNNEEDKTNKSNQCNSSHEYYDNNHEHQHTHGEHQHDHNDHRHNHEKHINSDSEHEHRNLSSIEAIIDNSLLGDKVKELSKRIFLKVAEAEAKIHGKALMEVHFHEVGAVDSIIDIIGAAICFDYLKVDKIISAPVELGGGFVKCAHGTFPVPAPATAEILKGVPVKLGVVSFETTTPTGAAILAATVNEFNDKKEFKINRVAYGIGHRDTEIPNVLRVYLGEINEESTFSEAVYTDVEEYEKAFIVECNIDDMNPELYDFTMEKLFNAGAMDVFLTNIIMKKGRPGIKLSVLCSESIERQLTNILLSETTTLGVRKYKVEKTMLKRETSTINTKYGEIGIKISFLNNEIIKIKPEYEDCKRIAKEKNLSISLVYEEARAEIKNL